VSSTSHDISHYTASTQCSITLCFLVTNNVFKTTLSKTPVYVYALYEETNFHNRIKNS
jgi:hypothetical protein